jgi:Site-specific recombinase XerD
MKWLRIYKKPFVSENTYSGSYQTFLENHIIPFFGSMEMADIKPFDIQSFFAGKSEFSKSTLNKFHMMLRAIFLTAVDNGLCERSPMTFIVYRSIKPKERKKVYSHGDMERVVEFFKQSFPAISFLLETGLRRGELLGLQWSDVDFKHSTISVNRSVCSKQGGGIELRPPKWNSYRVLPVSASGMALLASLPHTCEYVFPNRYGRAQYPRTFSIVFARHMRRMNRNLKLLTLSPHELRHTFGTDLRRRGVDIYTIQKVMGHKDINVTANLYVHNEVESLRAALGYKK